ncbi:hypothetical protein HPB50_006372 [Hyalomma asiaticum]|uniref:Uncharacterized protein n=1 Tax=Hyalomma asiaticum TaxID=266040 RepID=A0ACB7SKL3_HYAAI|nr:hypothetical protein HPB50_006372 [Hyalomma asiaticum]
MEVCGEEKAEEADAKCRQCEIEAKMEKMMATQTGLMDRIAELENALAREREKTQAMGKRIRKDSSHKKWLFSSVVSGLPLVTYGACVGFSALKFGGRSPHRKDAVQADAGGYQVLGDVRLPDEVAHLWKKGPKFSTEPSIPAHELLALNRRISRKAVLEDQERCLLDGVDSLRRTVTKNSPTSSALIKKTVSFFNDNKLRLLLSDKGG